MACDWLRRGVRIVLVRIHDWHCTSRNDVRCCTLPLCKLRVSHRYLSSPAYHMIPYHDLRIYVLLYNFYIRYIDVYHRSKTHVHAEANVKVV